MPTRDKFLQPDNTTARTIARLAASITVFRELDPAIPSGYILAFLAVARQPGRGVSDIAQELGMLRPVCSRILLEIGQKARTGGEGLGLVESVASHEDLRAVHYRLTSKGKGLLNKVLNRMGDT